MIGIAQNFQFFSILNHYWTMILILLLIASQTTDCRQVLFFSRLIAQVLLQFIGTIAIRNWRQLIKCVRSLLVFILILEVGVLYRRFISKSSFTIIHAF